MAYAFNDDRSKVEVSPKVDTDANLAAEASARQQADSALDTRIDNIVSNPITSEEAAQEVQDAKQQSVAAGGVTFPSLRDHINTIEDEVVDIRAERNGIVRSAARTSIVEQVSILESMVQGIMGLFGCVNANATFYKNKEIRFHSDTTQLVLTESAIRDCCIVRNIEPGDEFVVIAPTVGYAIDGDYPGSQGAYSYIWLSGNDVDGYSRIEHSESSEGYYPSLICKLEPAPEDATVLIMNVNHDENGTSQLFLAKHLPGVPFSTGQQAAENISIINNALKNSGIAKSINLFTLFNSTIGVDSAEYHDDVIIFDHSNYRMTDYIPVNSHTAFTVTGSTFAEVQYVYCYDDNKEFISRQGQSVNSLPEGTVFIRVPFCVGDDVFIAPRGIASSYNEPLDLSSTDLEMIFKRMFSTCNQVKPDFVNLISPTNHNIYKGVCINTAGDIVPDTDDPSREYAVSDFIEIPSEFVGNVICSHNTYWYAGNYARCFHLYDNDLKRISGGDDHNQTIPANAKYIRYCVAINATNTVNPSLGIDCLALAIDSFDDIDDFTLCPSNTDISKLKWINGLDIGSASTGGPYKLNANYSATPPMLIDPSRKVYANGTYNNYIWVFDGSFKLLARHVCTNGVALSDIYPTAKYIASVKALNATATIKFDYIGSGSHDNLVNGINLRFATYNTGEYVGRDVVAGSSDLASLMKSAIADTEARVFALQEDVPYFNSSTQLTSRDAIFKNWNNYYRLGNSNTNYKALLSDYPIKEVQAINYVGETGYSSGSFRHYYFLRGIVTINSIDILLICVHLDWSDNTARQTQIQNIIDYIEDYEYVIVMGDMNPESYHDGVPTSSPITFTTEEDLQLWIDAGYTPSNVGYLGEYNTWDGYENSRIWAGDNIIVSPNIQIKQIGRTKRDYMNDHYIFWADLSIC